jgi:predicted enzyme related to lactoylglutathione lyase
MNRVTGLGGIFFRCANPDAMKEWYRTHPGIDAGEHGTTFTWRDAQDPSKKCHTLWSTFPAGTKHLDPSTKQFMINYRVENLRALLEELKKHGVEVIGEIEENEYGKFGWIMDPEGNKIEHWEPVDETLNPA